MKIEHWLYRLGLEKHLKEFTNKDISFVSELKELGYNKLLEMNIESISLKNRFLGAFQ